MAYRTRRSRQSNSGGNSNEPREYVYHFLKPESGFLFLDYYIPTENDVPKGQTEIRVLPCFDGGYEHDPYAIDSENTVEAESGPSDSYDIAEVGSFAWQGEIMYKAGPKMMSFVTDTWTCRDGSVIEDNWSVARCFVKEIFNKLREAESEILAMGPNGKAHLTSIPPQWADWNGFWKDNQYQERRKSRLPNPTVTSFMQVAVRRYQGTPIMDTNGNPTWQNNVVFMLPSGVQNQLFTKMNTPRTPEQPLGIHNNMLGDIVTSQGGRVLYVQKFDQGSHGRSSWKYGADLDPEPTPFPAEYIQSVWRPWDQVIVTPKVEDVMEWLAEAYNWQAVAFALRETKYADLVPEVHLNSAAHILPVGAAPAHQPTWTPPPQQGYQQQGYQQQGYQQQQAPAVQQQPFTPQAAPHGGMPQQPPAPAPAAPPPPAQQQPWNTQAQQQAAPPPPAAPAVPPPPAGGMPQQPPPPAQQAPAMTAPQGGYQAPPSVAAPPPPPPPGLPPNNAPQTTAAPPPPAQPPAPQATGGRRQPDMSVFAQPPQAEAPVQEAHPVQQQDDIPGLQPPIDVQNQANVNIPPGVAGADDVAKFQSTVQKLKEQNGG